MKIDIQVLDRAEDISRLILSPTGPKIAGDAAGMMAFCQMMSQETWTAHIEGEYICCWGLIPPTVLSNQAYLWMHSSEKIRDHAFVIVRHSQLAIERMLEQYPRIVGDCLVDAHHSIRWLKWLGATFGEGNGTYIPFVIRKKING